MKLHIYIIAILSVFSMSACTDVITLELEDPDPVLVVDGYISNMDTIQEIRLSSLDNYFASEPTDYTKFKLAEVTLREDGVDAGSYVFNDTKMCFELPYEGIVGKEYQIHISLPDGSSYLSATELMEPFVPIDTIWYEFANVDGPSSSEGDYSILINTKEPEGLGDNYQWKSYINGAYNFLADDILVSDDRFVEGQDIIDVELYSMSVEDYELNKLASPTSQVIVKIEQTRISLRYYDYVTLVAQQILQVGSPFASPPAEIRGNVYKEGEDEVLALGYFYTSSIAAASVELFDQ